MIDTVKESGIDHDVNQNYDDDLLVPMVSTNTSSENEIEITIEKKNFIFYLYCDEDETAKKWKGIQRHWLVPKSFQFPKVDLKTGWELWILGMREFRITEKMELPRQRPFHHFVCLLMGNFQRK